MELNRSAVPEKVRLSGLQTVILPAGKLLKIETSPNGDEVLDAEVPVGKQWEVYLFVDVTETDA